MSAMLRLLRLQLVASLVGLAVPAGAEKNSSTCDANAKGDCFGVPLGKQLTIDTVPKKVLEAEYAVRGEIVTRSFKLDKILQEGNHSLPFDELVPCNIGNPQAVGAKPLSFHRQVLSILGNPALLEDPITAKLYPADVLARARQYIGGYPKFGAYSHSKGVAFFRQQVANYIDRRDAPKAGSSDGPKAGSNPLKVEKMDIEDIYLTDGATAGVKTVLEVMLDGPQDAILIPMPQYPLYSASVVRLGGTFIYYEMTEDYTSAQGWGIDVAVIEKRIKEFLATGGRVRGIAVINPGNPTGNVMTYADIEAVVRLCAKYKIVIMADEVYQDNVWRPDREFISFRQVVHETGLPVELFSFHSMSKGYYGECGLRGGVLTLTNIDEKVADQIYKLFSMILCANTLGQGMMASILNPPLPGEASYDLFQKEKQGIISSLNLKADLVANLLNSIPGVQTLPTEGAMYSFPSVFMPRAFIKEADAEGKAPDMLYCIKMLEATGVIVVPGSGFGQMPGTYHYRMTILPEEAKLRQVLGRMKKFHLDFLDKYLSPGERAIEAKTPTPCNKTYGDDVHKQVIESHLKGAKASTETPHMLLMLGGSGAGKGTFLRAVKLNDFVLHGLDEYIEYLPEYKATIANKHVVFKDAADGCYAGAIPIAKAAQKEMIKRKQHVAYEDTGKDLDRILKRVLPAFEEAGYRITVVLVDNTAEVAKGRATGRFMAEGRYSSDEYIESTYKNVPENYLKLREMPQVKEAYYCDNSCLADAAESTKEGGCLKCWLDKGARTLLPVDSLQSGSANRLVRA